MSTIRCLATLVFAVGFFTVTSKSEEPIKTTVRQDRIWIYENCKIPSVIDSVKFTRLEVIGDHEYHVYNGIGDLPYMREEAFVREEDGRIYRYMKDPVDAAHGPGEYLLYDLSANTGGRFEALLFKYDVSENTVRPYIANITVAEKWLFGLLDLPYTHSPYGGGEGSDLRGMEVYVDASRESDNFIFEEAGPAYRFSGIWTTPMLPEEGEYFQPDGYRFTGMSDIDGNLLCLGSHAVGVDAIEDTRLEKAGRMYDLNGREIHGPERGTIYIQDGKKRVVTR